jgi:hypothetical protein
MHYRLQLVVIGQRIDVGFCYVMCCRFEVCLRHVKTISALQHYTNIFILGDRKNIKEYLSMRLWLSAWIGDSRSILPPLHAS